MAGKNAPSAGSSPRTSVDQATRSSVDQPPSEREQEEPSTADTIATVADSNEAAQPAITIDDAGEGQGTSTPVEGAKEDDKMTAQPDVAATTTATPSELAEEMSREDRATAVSPPDQKENMVQLAKDMDEIKTRQQEEIQEYIERIDSLQSKLQYMSKNAAESAKKEASAAPSGSAERKLAEKNEKIALLMEEGQKLAGTEHKLRTVIKKLRAQMADTEKQMSSLREANTKSLADAQTLRNRLDGSEEKEKQQEEVRRTTAVLQKEIDSLRKQNTEKTDALRRQELEAKSRAEQAAKDHSAALDKAVAAERKTQKDLEESIAALQAEKESLVEQGRQDTSDWKEKHERAVERGTKIENDLKNELSAMEGKLENMRSAAEEASSGTGGEAQVKLLRQIETLQSQYASASSNWQGIETSLLAKISGLEKERDEAQRRESEMRKKARDAVCIPNSSPSISGAA
jgi:DNA repair exonuclease SbcCD ATPase subunit